ncbi:hypothetical protein [Clostridium oryzae]|uniref:Transporter n=1 Tax=Clostridium oryzae TaxID=1450648 RepID=A0A1V4IRI1_9CLOT|nr:hypothetical protein [Clostridium oryzae]OPJ62420.1 hypothetical protein CLORY_17890 [Clostridium oryzae]
MLFYNYPEYDGYRSEEDDDFEGLNDVSEVYELETSDLPPECPYRQFMPPMPGFPAAKPPTTPPPSTTPQKGGQASVKAVDPGSIRPCTFRFIFIWPERGRGFWAYLTFVGRRSVSGFRWNGRRWVYFGMDLRRIESFQCY